MDFSYLPESDLPGLIKVFATSGGESNIRRLNFSIFVLPDDGNGCLTP